MIQLYSETAQVNKLQRGTTGHWKITMFIINKCSPMQPIHQVLKQTAINNMQSHSKRDSFVWITESEC